MYGFLCPEPPGKAFFLTGWLYGDGLPVARRWAGVSAKDHRYYPVAETTACSGIGGLLACLQASEHIDMPFTDKFRTMHRPQQGVCTQAEFPVFDQILFRPEDGCPPWKARTEIRWRIVFPSRCIWRIVTASVLIASTRLRSWNKTATILVMIAIKMMYPKKILCCKGICLLCYHIFCIYKHGKPCPRPMKFSL